VVGPSPTVRQRELGMRLRELRAARHMTVEEVAAKLLCSSTKVSRAETGARRPSLRDVRDLCGVYGVEPGQAAELMELATEARKPGWWTGYDDLKITPFIGLEQAATSITCFGMYSFPALLQTRDYGRAVIKGIAPRIDPGILEQRLDARLRRQELLQQADPPRYRALLDESVLRRLAGGRDVMSEQLGKVLQLIRDGRITVQVLPFSVGIYASIDSNFDYLEFAGTGLPGVVFVEGLVSHLYQERPAELERYSEALEYLRDAALSPRDSAVLIEDISKTYSDSSI
jgi:transcriptional regulator with XRE-family HTH domain